MKHGHSTITIADPEQLVTLVRDRFATSVERSSPHTWSHRSGKSAGQLQMVLDLPHPGPAPAQEAVERGLDGWARALKELDGQQHYLVVWTTQVQRRPGQVMGMGPGLQVHLDLHYQRAV
jgi:hypothetical protein